MSKTIISTPHAPAGLAGYSQAVKAGGMVYVSGMGPIDATTGAIVGSTIQEQTARQPSMRLAAACRAWSGRSGLCGTLTSSTASTRSGVGGSPSIRPRVTVRCFRCPNDSQI
jgi:hypothetical protein